MTHRNSKQDEKTLNYKSAIYKNVEPTASDASFSSIFTRSSTKIDIYNYEYDEEYNRSALVGLSEEVNDYREESEQQREEDGTGWLNLIKLVAFLSIARFICTNLFEFGLLMDRPMSALTIKDLCWFFSILFINILRSMLFYKSVQAPALQSLSYIPLTEAFLGYLAVTNISYTPLACWSHILAVVYDLKLYSYFISEKKISFKTYLEFLSFPTLVYKDSYRRKSSIGYLNLIASFFKMIVFYLLMCFFMDQHTVPAIIKIHKVMVGKHCARTLIDSFMHLSISTIIVFNLFFRTFFVSFVTVLSELTRFDEKVYGEWWNSKSSGEFWKNWNLPVHKFVKHHIHNALRKRGFRGDLCCLLSFFISGVLHEYVVSMSLRSMNGWFFMAMIGQIPLYFVTSWVKKKFPQHANMFFWTCFSVIGQPMCVLLISRALNFEKTIK